jgi:hypothetical protein
VIETRMMKGGGNRGINQDFQEKLLVDAKKALL